MPLFFHCLTPLLQHSPSIFPLLSIDPHRSHIFFHCFSIVLLDIIFPFIPVSPVFFFTVFPPVLLNRPIVYTINFSFHFSDVSSVLPQCCSISPFHQFFQCFAMVLLDFSIIPLCYPSASNAHPNAPSTIPTVAPHKRFLLVSSMVFFPCVYSIVVTHQNGHFSIAFPMFHACFT